jgi:hypothetical protein
MVGVRTFGFARKPPPSGGPECQNSAASRRPFSNRRRIGLWTSGSCVQCTGRRSVGLPRSSSCKFELDRLTTSHREGNLSPTDRPTDPPYARGEPTLNRPCMSHQDSGRGNGLIGSGRGLPSSFSRSFFFFSGGNVVAARTLPSPSSSRGLGSGEEVHSSNLDYHSCASSWKGRFAHRLIQAPLTPILAAKYVPSIGFLTTSLFPSP